MHLMIILNFFNHTLQKKHGKQWIHYSIIAIFLLLLLRYKFWGSAKTLRLFFRLVFWYKVWSSSWPNCNQAIWLTSIFKATVECCPFFLCSFRRLLKPPQVTTTKQDNKTITDKSLVCLACTYMHLSFFFLACIMVPY